MTEQLLPKSGSYSTVFNTASLVILIEYPPSLVLLCNGFNFRKWLYTRLPVPLPYINLLFTRQPGAVSKGLYARLPWIK